MTVISDTTAITNLFQIGKIFILKEIFGTIIIPKAVELELAEIPGQLSSIQQLNFIEVKNPTDSISVNQLKSTLDDGEAEAIALAIELNADFLVIDDGKAVGLRKK